MHSTDAATSTLAGRKPREDEIDAHGVTHPGKVRKDNQDHFLLCSLRKQLVVRLSSIPDADGLMTETERLASLAMVADGVGGAARGETASRVALAGGRPSTSPAAMRCYYAAGAEDDQEFHDALQEGAHQCHAELRAPRRGGLRLPRHGHDAHPLPRRLAPRLPAPGGRQPLLPAPPRRADPDHPRPDDGAGDGGPRRDEGGGRGRHPAGPHAHELDRRPPDRTPRSPASR